LSVQPNQYCLCARGDQQEITEEIYQSSLSNRIGGLQGRPIHIAALVAPREEERCCRVNQHSASRPTCRFQWRSGRLPQSISPTRESRPPHNLGYGRTVPVGVIPCVDAYLATAPSMQLADGLGSCCSLRLPYDRGTCSRALLDIGSIHQSWLLENMHWEQVLHCCKLVFGSLCFPSLPFSMTKARLRWQDKRRSDLSGSSTKRQWP
jgi:hypothetical protein